MLELNCVRCGHTWTSFRPAGTIKRCARCKRMYYWLKLKAYTPTGERAMRNTMPELTALEIGQSVILAWQHDEFGHDSNTNRRALHHARRHGRVYHTTGSTHGLKVERVT